MAAGSGRIDLLSRGRPSPEGGAWRFTPSAKVAPLCYRTRPLEHTLTRLRACASRLPISRISDLTPLDPLRLPVFSATTPLARDLTTHLGKGLDAPSARVSAMMEAVERVSAERTDRPVRRASYARLMREAACCVDPRAFDLPDDSRYRENWAIDWVEGWDLLNEVAVWVPVDLTITPPREGVLRHVDTNGLAAGNDLLEAVVHGLCEVIERDAVSQLLFRSLFDANEQASDSERRLDVSTLPPEGQQWTARLRAAGLAVAIDVLETDIGVPIFRTVIHDARYPSPGSERARRFVGFGAAPNATAAVLRSITEAVQSRLAIVQGARDSFNSLSPPGRDAAAGPSGAAHTRPPCALGDVPSFVTDDLREDLRYLLRTIARTGFTRVIAVDLTRPAFDLPVVRIRVPGMATFAVNQRRLGWRCLRHLL